MDSRFSDISRKILRLSHDIAAELGYNYVGTEHIVAGILRDGTTDAASAMEEQGINYDDVVAKITEENAPSGKVNPNQALPITPRTKAVLELSFNEAIERSMDMMEGHKMQYFLLSLSFIGWILLAIISCGILSLWVNPYISATYAHFYEYVKDEYEKRITA